MKLELETRSNLLRFTLRLNVVVVDVKKKVFAAVGKSMSFHDLGLIISCIFSSITAIKSCDVLQPEDSDETPLLNCVKGRRRDGKVNGRRSLMAVGMFGNQPDLNLLGSEST